MPKQKQIEIIKQKNKVQNNNIATNCNGYTKELKPIKKSTNV